VPPPTQLISRSGLTMAPAAEPAADRRKRPGLLQGADPDTAEAHAIPPLDLSGRSSLRDRRRGVAGEQNRPQPASGWAALDSRSSRRFWAGRKGH